MLNPIRIVFQQIHEPVDKAQYINDRLELLLQASEADPHPDGKTYRISSTHQSALIRLVLNSQFAEPKLAATGEHPELSGNQQLIAGERIQCAFDTIQSINPLLPGEQLISQQQSYLAEDYLGYTSRTGVIRQETNMATLYFVFLDCFIEPSGDVQWVPPRDRQQKNLLSQAINQLPSDCEDRKYLHEKLEDGLRHLVPVPYNILAVTAEG